MKCCSCNCKEEARYKYKGKAYCCDCFIGKKIEDGDIKTKNVNITVYEYDGEEYWDSSEYTFEQGYDELLEKAEINCEPEYLD